MLNCSVSKRPRKRIKMMADSSDEEEEKDIDLDDDIGDPDFAPKRSEGKNEAVEEESSSEESGDASGDEEEIGESEEDSLDAIKAKYQNGKKPASNRQGAKGKTPVGKTSFSGSFAQTPPPAVKSTANLKNKLIAFASPSTISPQKEDGPDLSSVVPSHLHLGYKWLQNPCDKKQRKRDHPDYDATTLHVPESFLKEQTPAQHQWWKLKSQHFDTVLFFKMGKFYELFHMDAVLAVEKCGLTYMRAKAYAHCGFPEVGYQKYADMLVDFGFKVARIEQTETPDMMEERCRKLKAKTKFDKVVNREICQMTSKGTRLATTGTTADLCYLTAVSGQKIDGQNFQVGVCFVDTSVGTLNLSSFNDDSNFSKLGTMLAIYPPSELLYDPKALPAEMFKSVVQKHVYAANLSTGGVARFPDAKKTMKLIHDGEYFHENEIPDQLKVHLSESDMLMQTAKSESESVLASLGAIINHLQMSLIDQFVLTSEKIVNVNPIDVERKICGAEVDVPPGSMMILDSKTLRNLDLIGGKAGQSMFAVLDKTQTPMGKRLLKQWVSAPLLRKEDILERQNALTVLQQNTMDAIPLIKSGLKGMQDMERMVASIHVAGVKLSDDHPESRAIYYENTMYNSKKIQRLVSCLDSLTTANNMFRDVQELDCQNNKLLTNTFKFESNGGQNVNLEDKLEFFKKAFNHEKALKEGKIIPKKGVDEAYDESQKLKQELESDVQEYLGTMKKHFGSRDIKYFGSGPNAFQLEVPEAAAKKAGNDFTLSSQRKGFRRFHTEETKDLLRRQNEVIDTENAALAEVSRNMFVKFSAERVMWETVCHKVALVDALLSLCDYSFSSLDESQSCFPQFVPASATTKPFVKVEGGRHPVVIAVSPDQSFIPNDFELDERLAILTGANMGGKSTLMRQTALLVVLAQMGCRVPALQMSLSPVDRIFTRIGAADNMFDRESTFFVELAETSVILRHANRHSLVLIDELGRGTTTFDGCAIAHAVSNYLKEKTQCRTIFSTHYHELTQEYSESQTKGVLIYHMNVMESPSEEESSDGSGDIVFLYTVGSGPCSKSHGFNAAKLAGLPKSIIEVGRSVAEEFEIEQKNLLQFSKIINSH